MDAPTRLDFQAIKAGVSIERVIPILGLTMKQEGKTFRGLCPACKSDDKRALAITPEKKSYYCFNDARGGDVIALCAHIRGTGMREAAHFLHAHFRPVPQEPRDNVTPIRPQEPAHQSAPAAKESQQATGDNVLTPLSHLVFESEHVQQLGIDAATAAALGVGFTSRGMMRGRIAVPLRSDTGKLLGYIGLAPGSDVKLPPSFRF